VLERLADLRGPPRSITVDHGLEFEGQVPDAWAYAQNVQLGFVRPGKPVDSRMERRRIKVLGAAI
jgi:putative transposase